MPVDTGMIIALLTFFIAAATLAKTRRPGPVFTVVIAGVLVLISADPAFLGQLGAVVKRAILWFFGLFTG